MSAGQGSISFSSKARFTNAINGLSVVESNVILGQQVGTPDDPAGLLFDTEIPLQRQRISFSGEKIKVVIDDRAFGYLQPSFSIKNPDPEASDFIRLTQEEDFQLRFFIACKRTNHEEVSGWGNLFEVNPTDNYYALGDVGHWWNNTGIHIYDNDGDEFIFLEAHNGFRTSQPDSNYGYGPNWKLGGTIAEAVELDAANYVQVSIGGEIYKLALAKSI